MLTSVSHKKHIPDPKKGKNKRLQTGTNSPQNPSPNKVWILRGQAVDEPMSTVSVNPTNDKMKE